MTRLFIALSFLVTFSTLTAQEDFNGIWGSDDTSYLTTIIASEYKVLNVFNTSFEEHRVIPEEIINQVGAVVYNRIKQRVKWLFSKNRIFIKKQRHSHCKVFKRLGRGIFTN